MSIKYVYFLQQSKCKLFKPYKRTFFSSNSAFKEPNSSWPFSRGRIFCSICSTWQRRAEISLKQEMLFKFLKTAKKYVHF